MSYQPHPEQLSFFHTSQGHRSSSERNDVRKGDAAEMYVIAKLLNWGFDAHDARRDLPYDVVVDLGAGGLCRLQVKARSQPSGGRWSFRATRGNWRSATGTYAYTPTDYDATVLFALSLERALFLPGVHPQVSFRTEDFLRPDEERASWLRVVELQMKKARGELS